MRILVVDGERAVREALERALRLEGYEVELATDGQQALMSIAGHTVDAIRLYWRRTSPGGIVSISRWMQGDRQLEGARLSNLAMKALALEGVDDYLVKPFALEELLARLRALLRRTTGEDGPSFADLTLDPGTHEVQRGDRPIELTRTEFLLLELFLRNPRQVLTRDVIFDRVWADFGPTSNSLRSTSATSAARPRPAASRASSRRCAASGTAPASRRDSDVSFRLRVTPAAAAVAIAVAGSAAVVQRSGRPPPTARRSRL